MTLKDEHSCNGLGHGFERLACYRGTEVGILADRYDSIDDRELKVMSSSANTLQS
jgi:hypothetical protein